MEQVLYSELVEQSKRSYKFKIDGIDKWIPKNIIEDWSTEKKILFVPIEFYNKNLKK